MALALTDCLTVRAGAGALAHLRAHGLRADDVSAIPAAAGGPKGLILHHIDQWLFGTWLKDANARAPRERTLIGASIGAWRMAAATQHDPVAAFDRLRERYIQQRYDAKPTPREVSDVGRALTAAIIGGHAPEMLHHPHHRLHILAVRGRGALAQPRTRGAEARGYARATLANLRTRKALAHFLDRTVFHNGLGLAPWLTNSFDDFATHAVQMDEGNWREAMLASGSIPLILEPVINPQGAPTGAYWDGGIIDYHIHLPYPKAGGIVLYPHFVDYVVPGWLDKALPWRRLGQKRHGDAWLDNVVLVSPSAAFVATLPNRKLPDRSDFKKFGIDHDARIVTWNRGVAEAQVLRDAFVAFQQDPLRFGILPL
jgi:hypothetical protein